MEVGRLISKKGEVDRSTQHIIILTNLCSVPLSNDIFSRWAFNLTYMYIN